MTARCSARVWLLKLMADRCAAAGDAWKFPHCGDVPFICDTGNCVLLFATRALFSVSHVRSWTRPARAAFFVALTAVVVASSCDRPPIKRIAACNASECELRRGGSPDTPVKRLLLRVFAAFASEKRCDGGARWCALWLGTAAVSNARRTGPGDAWHAPCNVSPCTRGGARQALSLVPIAMCMVRALQGMAHVCAVVECSRAEFGDWEKAAAKPQLRKQLWRGCPEKRRLNEVF